MKIDSNKFEQFRQAANLTRSELAEVAGLSHVRIWQIGTDTSEVNEHIVAAMCRKMKCKPSDIEFHKGVSA